MVRLHNQATADSKMEPNLRQCSPKLVEFSIHFDAQCLEHTFGRIAATTPGGRNHCIDQGGELARGLEGTALALLYDALGYRLAEALLAILLEYMRKPVAS